MKRFRAVFSTYFRRRQFWLLAFWGFLFVGLDEALLRVWTGRIAWTAMAFGVVCISAAVGEHLKEQLGAYRSALLPRFRTPHIVVALFWVAVAVLPFPLISALGDNSVLGTAGPAVLLAALALASCCRGGAYLVVTILFYVVLSAQPCSIRLQYLLEGRYLWLAGVALLTGLTLLAETVRFLLTMDEETPGYAWEFRGNPRGLRGPQARRAGFEATRVLEERNSIWLRLVGWGLPETRRCVAGSRWRRIVHWRRASANWWTAVLTPLLVWLLLAGMQFGTHSAATGNAWALQTMAFVAVLMPQILFFSVWQSRSGLLSREFTYPVRRRDIVIERGISILACQYLAWGLLMAGMAHLTALLPDPPSSRFMVTTVAITGIWQLVSFGINARLSTSGSFLWVQLSYALNTGIGMGVLFACQELHTPALLIGVSGLIAVLGALALFLAYRHWLTVDLP